MSIFMTRHGFAVKSPGNEGNMPAHHSMFAALIYWLFPNFP